MLLLAGCHQDMWNQPRYEALEHSELFDNGMASRTPVEGTVSYAGARREWWAPVYAELSGTSEVPRFSDERFWTGRNEDGTFMEENYFPVTRELIARGQQRYAITCTPCHNVDGAANGYIVSRGMPNPTSFHIDRLREETDGYFFDVITNGFGRMYSYASRVRPEDRWAIVAYIRALQASQNVDIDALPAEASDEIMAALEAPTERDAAPAVEAE